MAKKKHDKKNTPDKSADIHDISPPGAKKPSVLDAMHEILGQMPQELIDEIRKQAEGCETADEFADAVMGPEDEWTAEELFKELKASDEFEDSEGGEPWEEAEAIMDDANQAEHPLSRLMLARTALLVDPGCVDAYMLLAEDGCESPGEACELLRKGRDSIAESFGPDALETGDLFAESREGIGYLQITGFIVYTLIAAQDFEGAAEEAKRALQVEPSDPMSIASTLAFALIVLGREDEALEILDSGSEDRVARLYAHALLAFKREGNSPEALRLLVEAKIANRHVPAFLLADFDHMDLSPTDLLAPGSKDEAIHYAELHQFAWQETPGALDWLRAATPSAPKRDKKRRTRK